MKTVFTDITLSIAPVNLNTKILCLRPLFAWDNNLMQYGKSKKSKQFLYTEIHLLSDIAPMNSRTS